MRDLKKAKDGEPCDFICPYCGLRWNETEENWYDGEYGFFMLNEGKETVEFTCAQHEWNLGSPRRIRGCGKLFRVDRNVDIKVSYVALNLRLQKG